MANNKIIDLDRLSRFKDKLDDVLETKANVDGNYPTMTVGSADNLTPYGENSGVEESTPFVFQTAGGSSDIGSQAQLRALRGNSVAFNQLIRVSTTSQTLNGLTITNNNDGSITISGTATADTTISVGGLILPQNHKYLLKGCPSGGSSSTYYYIDANYPNTRDTGNGVIYTYAYSWTTGMQIKVLNGTNMGTGKVFKPQLFDLTLMFGAGNEPTSVLEFNRLFPKPYYEYNAGTLLSCKSNGYKTVGYNAFDGELEQGLITNGNASGSSANGLRTKNYIRVVAGQQYTWDNDNSISFNGFYVSEYDGNNAFIKETRLYASPNNQITLTNNTQYIKFHYYSSVEYASVPSNPQIAFHLTWDESRTGYEPYESETYPLPNVELRSAGSVYDELKPDGTLIRRIGIVDLGDFTWVKSSQNRFVTNITGAKTTTNDQKANILCSKFQTNNADSIYLNKIENTIGISSSSQIVVFVSSTYYTNTSADQFKTAMNGVYLFYELATSTEEQTEYTFAETTPIDDYGTQEFLYDNDIDIPVPQGNDFFYPVDYKAFIDSLGGRDDIEYAADQVVSQTELTQALSTFLSSIQGYDATKTQTLKNVNGVFQWVDD